MDEENFIAIEIKGKNLLGETLTLDYSIRESSVLKETQKNLKDFRKKVSISAEWIVIEPSDK